MTISLNLGGFGSFTSHTGSSPEPFDAINGHRLAGPQGSHPLHAVAAEELLRPHDDAVTGEIVLDHPAMVGEGITGTLRFTAIERIDARKAALRLVGLRLDEVRRSTEDRDSEGHVTHTDDWVETDGNLFIKDAFPEPAIPASLQPGESFEARFAVPAPRLGPPTAHLGESIVAWALEVRWDVPMGSDHFVAAYLPLAQHPDLLRAGVGKQGGMSLLAGVPVGRRDDQRDLAAACPGRIRAGGRRALAVGAGRVEGPRGAPPADQRPERHGGDHRLDADRSRRRSGAASWRGSLVPAGSAPSFDGAGLEINYVIRVLVDRRLRSDAAIERPVAIV